MKVNSTARSGPRALGIGVLVTGLAACGAVNAGSGDENSGMPSVTFSATTNPSSIGTIATLIDQEKLDEQCGVQMDSQYASPDAAEIALLSGKADIGYFGYNSWAGSSEKLSQLAMLAPLQAEHGTLFVPQDSPAQDLKDLRGKRIALLPEVSGQYQDFDMLTAELGYNLQTDFETVTGPPPAIEAFLKRGEVDAAIIFEPAATNLMAAGGYRPVLDLNDKWQSLTGEPLHMLGVSANKSWLSDHGKEAQCVVEAVGQAAEMLATDGSVYQQLSGVLGANGNRQLQQLKQNLGGIYTLEQPEQAEPAIRSQLEKAKQLGLVHTVPDQIFTSDGS